MEPRIKWFDRLAGVLLLTDDGQERVKQLHEVHNVKNKTIIEL